MDIPKIVIDTNVLVSALRSKRGTSYKLIMLIGKNKFECNISVPLIFEYEQVVFDPNQQILFSKTEINKIFDFICANSNHYKIYYLWRPYLKDQKDDLVLELAVSSNSDFIVTFNQKDFIGVKQFGIHVVTSKEFLKLLGELS